MEVGKGGAVILQGKDCSPRKEWSKMGPSHTARKVPSRINPPTWGQGGVRAGEEEDHVGLSARVLMNGLGAPLTPRDMTPRAAGSASVARNATWNQGDRTVSPASLGESRLVVCPCAMHVTPLSLASWGLWRSSTNWELTCIDSVRRGEHSNPCQSLRSSRCWDRSLAPGI